MSKRTTGHETTEQHVKSIRRATRKQYSAEEKIRIVLEGLRGEQSIAELCRREGIAQGLYYSWSKEFLEAGKKRLSGDTAREARVQHRRRDLQQLWRAGQDHRVHRGSGGNREDSHPYRAPRHFNRRLAFATVSGAAAGQFVRLIHGQPVRATPAAAIPAKRQGRCRAESRRARKLAPKCEILRARPADTACKRALTAVRAPADTR